PIRLSRLTASSSTSIAILVSTNGTAALAQTRPGYFFCAPAISSFQWMAASRPSSGGSSEKNTENGPIEHTTSTWSPSPSMCSSCLSRSYHSAQLESV